MKSRSLVFRLTVLQLVLAAALIAAFAISAIWLSARTLERQESSFLSNCASLVAASLDHEWREETDLRRAAAAALEQEAPLGVQIEILDELGHRIVATAPIAKHVAPGELREQRIHLSRGAWVVATMSTRARRSAVAALIMALGLTALPLFIGVAAISRALARGALRPLSRMTAQAGRTSLRGVLRPLGRPSDPAEVVALAEAFNRLIARLADALRAEQHFTQDAAHELRTPITVLSGELEYALSDSTLPEKHRHSLTCAWDQVRQMSELVEALLLLRRTEEEFTRELDQSAPVNLSELVDEVARELVSRAPLRARDLQVDARDEVLVAGHPILLGSAIRNLLSNALKFTHEGQSVRVTVARLSDRGTVVVEDGGPGVAPEARERIFDPFFRGPEARAQHEGSGLGLPILRRVARAHGGDVVAGASALGGARFELALPAWVGRA